METDVGGIFLVWMTKKSLILAKSSFMKFRISLASFIIQSEFLYLEISKYQKKYASYEKNVDNNLFFLLNYISY